MSLEDLTGPDKFISALDRNNPAPNDPLNEGNFHISGMKNVLLNQFPNLNAAVTLTDEQLNNLAYAILRGNSAPVAALLIGASEETQGDVRPILYYEPQRNGCLIRCTDGAGNYSYFAFNGPNPAVGQPLALEVLGGEVHAANVVASSVARAGYVQGQTQVQVGFGNPSGDTVTMQIDGTDAVVDFINASAGFWRIAAADDGALKFGLNGAFSSSIDTTGRFSQIGRSRSNVGFVSYSGANPLDVGKAPGVYREKLVSDANGDVTLVFPYTMNAPVISAIAEVGNTPSTCSIISTSGTGAVVRLAEWTGSNWGPGVGRLVHCIAFDSSLAPS
jgi:hypothetical protein